MMALRSPRTVLARGHPIRRFLPRANTFIQRQPSPLQAQSPAFFSTKPDPEPPAPLPAAAIQNAEAKTAHQVLWVVPHILGRPGCPTSGAGVTALPTRAITHPASPLDEPPPLMITIFCCLWISITKLFPSTCAIWPITHSAAPTPSRMPSIYTDSSAGASSYSAVPTARRRSGKKFLALVQGHARECFEQAGLIDVYSRMRWTVFEDAAGLDGADIAETSRRFIDLVQRGPGGEELAGSAFTSIIGGTPRHEFFLHVDEESLESVVDDAKAKEKSGYFCTVVMPGNVVLWEIKRDREGIYRFCEDGREVEEDEMWDLRKRVRIDDPVSLYAELHVSLDLWYCLLSFPDNPDIFVP